MAENLKVIAFPNVVKPKRSKRKKYEREDGRFCKRVMVDGKSYSFYGSSAREVEQKAKEFKTLMEHGLDATEYDMTVEQWGRQWFDAVLEGKSIKHRDNIQRQLDLINQQIGGMRVRDVRELHLTKIINSRSGFSKSQIDKLHNTIQRVFSAARKNRIIIIDPAIDLKKPHGTYTGHRALEPWELDLLLKHYDCAPAGEWAIAMMLSGLRREEMLALTQDSIDFEHGKIRVTDTITFVNNSGINTGKTKTDAGCREIPMLDPLTSILKCSFDERPRQLFATTVTGNKISQSSYISQWRTLLNRLSKIASGFSPASVYPKNPERRKVYEEKLKNVHFTAHDLRYTYATILYDAEVDEKTAQRWLGHTSPEMTRDLYAKLSAERKAKSDQNLIQYFKRFTQEP